MSSILLSKPSDKAKRTIDKSGLEQYHEDNFQQTFQINSKNSQKTFISLNKKLRNLMLQDQGEQNQNLIVQKIPIHEIIDAEHKEAVNQIEHNHNHEQTPEIKAEKKVKSRKANIERTTSASPLRNVIKEVKLPSGYNVKRVSKQDSNRVKSIEPSKGHKTNMMLESNLTQTEFQATFNAENSLPLNQQLDANESSLQDASIDQDQSKINYTTLRDQADLLSKVPINQDLGNAQNEYKKASSSFKQSQDYLISNKSKDQDFLKSESNHSNLIHNDIVDPAKNEQILNLKNDYRNEDIHDSINDIQDKDQINDIISDDKNILTPIEVEQNENLWQVGIPKGEFEHQESELKKVIEKFQDKGNDNFTDIEDLNTQELEKLTSNMQKQENLLLFSEINVLMQQNKNLSKKLLEIESSKVQEDFGQKTEIFRILSEGLTEKTLSDKHANSFGIELTKHYSNLSQKLRSEIDKYIELLKETNLKFEKVQDECTYHRMSAKINEKFIDQLLDKFDILYKENREHEAINLKLKNNLRNSCLIGEKNQNFLLQLFKQYSKISNSLKNFKKTFTTKFYDHFLKSFKVFMDSKFEEISSKGIMMESLRDHKNQLNVAMPALKKTIKDYFNENLSEFLNLKLDGFQKISDSFIKTDELNKELSELTAKVIKLEKTSEGSRNKVINDMSNTRLTKLKDESRENQHELQKAKEECKQVKNLQFLNQLLLMERQEQVAQFKSQDHICQECFRLVTELKRKLNTDQQTRDKENMLNIKNDTKEKYEGVQGEAVSNLNYSLELFLNQMKTLNYPLQDIISMQQKLIMDTGNKQDDSKLKDVLKRVKELEGEYSDLLVKYNQASQCVIEFIGKEMDLVKDIDTLKQKTDAQDAYIDSRHEEIQKLKRDKDELVQAANKNEKLQDDLQRKVLKVFDTSEPQGMQDKPVSTCMVVQLQNKNYELEAKLSDYTKKVEQLDHVIHSQQHKIKELMEDVRQNETRSNIIEQKLFTSLSEKNKLESENKLQRLAGNFEKLGSNGTHNIQFKNLILNIRTEYDDQITKITSLLNEMICKYQTLVNIDLESRYKKVFQEKNELSVNYVRLQQEMKAIEGQKHYLEQLLEKVNQQMTDLQDCPLQLPNASGGDSSYDLMEKLLVERNKSTSLDKEYKFLLSEQSNLKSLQIENWQWIMEVNNEQNTLNFEQLKTQEMLNLKSIAYEKQIDEQKNELFNYNDCKKREKNVNEKYNFTVTEYNLLASNHEKTLLALTEKTKQLELLEQRFLHTLDDNKKTRTQNTDLERNLQTYKEKYTKAENKIVVEKKLDEKEIDRLNEELNNLQREFKVNKGGIRKQNKSPDSMNEVKSTLERMSQNLDTGNIFNPVVKQESFNMSNYKSQKDSPKPTEEQVDEKSADDKSEVSMNTSNGPKVRLPSLNKRSISTTPMESKTYSMNTMQGRKDKIAEFSRNSTKQMNNEF